MARKAEFGTRSEAIRAYLRDHPDARTKVIQADRAMLPAEAAALSAEQILEAKRFSERFGGISAARWALDALERLR